MSYHIDNAGDVRSCRARLNKCPYGGESGTEHHYDTKEEARAAYEGGRGTASSLLFDLGTNPGPALLEEAARAKKTMWGLKAKVKKATPAQTTTQWWFTAVQQGKSAAFAAAALEREAESHMTQEERTRREDERAAKRQQKLQDFENWKKRQDEANGSYNFHPEVTEANSKLPRTAIAAFSGLTPEAVEAEVARKMLAGATRTEAYRELWREVPLRTDKALVAVDLEVASEQASGYVDRGPYSNIIEVGVVVREPDGSEESFSFLNDVPENFALVEGTGAEHVHHISLTDIQDRPVFVQDADNQKKLLGALTDSVMVAHNASYEENQLKHNLWGYNHLVQEGRLEVLDTRQVLTYFYPETKDNTNASLVATAGIPYEGAHRALADARMTLDALLALKRVTVPGDIITTNTKE
jgi:DNA polymerase III epsilon subunit-like protein